MRSKLYITVISLLLVVKANASTQQPSPPNMAALANGSACSKYAKSMFDYLFQSSDFTDSTNAIWFKSFGETRPENVYRQDCTNGSCTNYYGVEGKYGVDPGCFIATTNAQAAKQSLLEHLSQAYQAAMAHKYINNGIGKDYGLYGDAKSCLYSNNYADCNLYYNE